MRRQIVLSLLVLIVCAAVGAGLAFLYIGSTNAQLKQLVELHRIEELRRRLIITVQAAQADLYSARTSAAGRIDVIVDNVEALEKAAARCSGCHHPPALASRLESVNQLIGDYETALSYYITASANQDRILSLGREAEALANQLLDSTEKMSIEASRRIEEVTAAELESFDHARAILSLTLSLTLLVAVAIAIHLTRSITGPIDALVRATRAIAGGNLGYSLELAQRNEFDELASHFNSMSVALREGYAALQAEIAERKSVEKQLLHDALHDALTALPNRALFLDRLQHLIESSRRPTKHRFAVLFLDLDRFKVVNDTLGHVIGDRVLAAVGRRIEACLRPGDTVARLGGDEFGLILEDVAEPGDVLPVTERLQRSLSSTLILDGQEVFVTASIGVAFRSDDHENPEQLLRDADISMYQAKIKGRACTVTFDAAMHGGVLDQLELEADLRRAVEHGDQFLLHFQPILVLRERRLSGVEALLRWRHPRRGLLDASAFISLAEESGAIVPIGAWVVRAACAQLRTWQERAPALDGVTMSINISIWQFRRADFVETLQQVLSESAVDPRLIILELTESVIMDDAVAAATKLGRLRELGIQVHVDDFGTGYSSLSYLHRFPITAVKIDRTFVAGLPHHAESEAMIKAIVSISENLNLDLIAEGIETEEHATRLEELRCRLGQGFFLARPVSAEALEAWVVSRESRGSPDPGRAAPDGYSSIPRA